MAGQVLQMGVYMHNWCVDARIRKELMQGIDAQRVLCSQTHITLILFVLYWIRTYYHSVDIFGQDHAES